jgi:D-3-phosphoglycerate dehydrogenase / 2-oxoglutarate reductase
VKSEPGKLTLKRLALSPYHQDGFRQQEITMLNELDIQDSNSNSNHDFYITNTSFDFTTISNEDFNHSTKLMIHPNSGYDNIPAAFVKNATYPIVLGNKIRARAVAEYTLSCLFHHMTKLKNQKDWTSGRYWNRKLLEDNHVLIIGYGRIGKILEASLRPLTSRLTILDPFKLKTSKSEEIKEKFDIVLMATSLNKSSLRMIDSTFLQQCSDTLLFINGARGKLVAQEELISFLIKNKNAFAYLDVFEKEPANFDDFDMLKNVQLSSHIAGVSMSLDQMILDFEREVLSDFLTLTKEDFNILYSPSLLQNRLHEDQDGLFLI